MKKYFCLFLIISLSLNSTAQEDSIQNQILNYADSNAQIIAKGRGLLAENLMKAIMKK